MTKFGAPASNKMTRFGSGGQDSPEIIHCHKYTLTYKIAIDNEKYRRSAKRGIGGSITPPSMGMDGNVQVWAKLHKKNMGGVYQRFCWHDVPPDDRFCESCKHKSKVLEKEATITHQCFPDEDFVTPLSKAFRDRVCPARNSNIQPPVGTPMNCTSNSTGLWVYETKKIWEQCGTNEELEAKITPGQDKKLDFNNVDLGSILGRNEGQYNITCKLFKMFDDVKDKDCGQENLLCAIVNNTIFGAIGSKAGGMAGDCDFAENTWVIREGCEIRTGIAFENWLANDLDKNTPINPPEFLDNVPYCPGCPGCNSLGG